MRSLLSLFPLEVVGAVFQVLGSAFAKFAFGGDSVPAALAHKKCQELLATSTFQYAAQLCTASEYAVRGGFFVLLLLANAFGMMLVLKGMARSGSLKATVLATATNTLVTAVVGSLLFGEVLTLKWGAGAGMIVTGVVLLSAGSKTEGANEEGEGKDGAAARVPTRSRAAKAATPAASGTAAAVTGSSRDVAEAASSTRSAGSAVKQRRQQQGRSATPSASARSTASTVTETATATSSGSSKKRGSGAAASSPSARGQSKPSRASSKGRTSASPRAATAAGRNKKA